MKILRYIIFTLAAVSLMSCSLDEKNFTEKDQAVYMNNTSEANTVLMGVYRDMVVDGMYGFHLSLFFTLPSDVADVEGSGLGNWRAVANNSYTSADGQVLQTWSALYKAVYNANDFIERLAAKSVNYPEDQKNLAAVYMAEARALRALYYFELVRWFGNVPLITSTDQARQPNDSFKQADPVDVYKFIESDLLYAIENLPYANEDTYRSANAYRISKGGALGLLAKVYATWAGYPLNDATKWEEAAKTARTLIQSGNHGLLEDYEQLWKNACESEWDATESLIEVSFYSPVMTGTTANDPNGRIGKWNGVSTAEGVLASGKCAANWKVVPAFAANWWKSIPAGQTDKRFDISIAARKYTTSNPEGISVASGKEPGADGKDETVYYTIGQIIDMPEDNKNFAAARKNCNNGICPGKWDMAKYAKKNQVTDANFSNVNWYILRYADVLLLYAEALNEWQQGPTTDAYAAINMVRRRAYGLPLDAPSSVDLATGMSYEAFRQAVRDERAKELAFEGHRRQDLIRWGIYYETVKKTYSELAAWHEEAPGCYRGGEFTTKGQHELLPIPLNEIKLSGLKQNNMW